MVLQIYTRLPQRKILRLPSLCRICNQYHRDPHAICQPCTALLEPLGPACHHCAVPLPDQTPLICGACLIKRPALDRVFVAYRYTEPLRTLIHAFKYEAALYLSSFLCDLMLQAKEECYTTDCLIPIPLHGKRLQKRGFNQTAILAQQLSALIQQPYALYACTKVVATNPQAGLTAKQRRSNLVQAFEASHLPYQHVTLVDDLYTTGATANEVAKTLKAQAGVQQVDLICCARA